MVSSGGDFTTEIVELEKNDKLYRMLLIEPAQKPFASVVMFKLMGGTLPISGTHKKPVFSKYCVNFVMRTMYDFARKGFRVLIAARPYWAKRQGPKVGWLSYYRLEDEHIDELRAIVSFVKNRSNQPVWLLGSQEGTLSAVQGAMHMKEIDGIALVSPMVGTFKNEFIRYEKPNVLLDVKLETIEVPVILVSHRDDPSGISSCRGSNKIKNRLINSPSVRIECLKGGKPYPYGFVKYWKRANRPTNRPHAFCGIEKKVVNVVTDFMKSSIQGSKLGELKENSEPKL